MSDSSSSHAWFVQSFTQNAATGNPSLRLVANQQKTGSASTSSSSSSSSVAASSSSADSSILNRGVILGNGCGSGEQLLSETAFLSSMNSKALATRCSACWTTLGDHVKRCSACTVTRYCDATCQKNHWTRSHRFECSCLKPYKDRSKERHPIYAPTVWLVCQLLMWNFQRPLREFRAAQVDEASKATPTWQAKDKERVERDARELEPFEAWMKRFDKLEGHLSAHTPDRRSSYAEMATLVREVTSFLCANEREKELHAQLFPIDWFIKQFARLACNSFTVCDAEQNALGLAVFPVAAMVNHSCEPNSWASFEFVPAGVRIQIKSLRSIRSGEEIHISYISLAQNREKRHRELRNGYFFDCECQRCTRWSHSKPLSLQAIQQQMQILKLSQQKQLTAASQNSGPPTPTLIPRLENEWLHDYMMSACICAHAWRDSTRQLINNVAKDANGSDRMEDIPASVAVASNTPCQGANDGVLLPTSFCDASPPAHPCTRCECLHSASEIERIRAEELTKAEVSLIELCAKVERMKSESRQGVAYSDAQKARFIEWRSELASIETRLKKMYHPLHQAFLQIHECQLKMSIELEQWQQALDAVKASLPGYDSMYDSLPHSLYILQYMMYAKLSWLLEHSLDALLSWRKVLPLAKIVFGEKHQLTKDIIQAIPPAEAEVAEAERQGKLKFLK